MLFSYFRMLLIISVYLPRSWLTWQSIAANIMTLPVRIPTGSEAAAMGGAIQALWCLKKSEGAKTSIEDLTDEHVALGDVIKPEKKSVEKYNDAYAVYSRYLGALSPLYK